MFKLAALCIAFTPTVAETSLAHPRSIPRADELEGAEQTEHFIIRFRPGSRAAASIDRTAHVVEQDYAEIVRKLDLEGLVSLEAPFELCVYDDLAELAAVTGVTGTAGFSAGRTTHVPWDNDQTRKHELVHIVVAAMASTGEEERNMFFAEGLANAVLEYVHGIPVHSVAAYERKRGSLPDLETLATHTDFYAFLRENPGLNAYDVAASYFLFLLETHPPRKVMEYYHGRPIHEALEISLAEAEKRWHARLDDFPIRPGLETLLRQRRGDGGTFVERKGPRPPVALPPDLLGEESSWRDLLGTLQPSNDVGTWRVRPGPASCENASGGDWSHAMAEPDVHGDCVIRMRATTGPSCWGLKIRYGDHCEAMVLGQGAFIYTEKGGVAHTKKYRLKPNAEVELAMVVRGRKVELFVDGHPLLEADLALEPSVIGAGLVGGSATFDRFEVRSLSNVSLVSSRLEATDSGDLVLTQDVRIHVPATEAWEALATAEGLTTWMSSKAEIDLRVGGTIRTHDGEDAAIGDDGTRTFQVLSVVPGRLLSLREGPADDWPNAMKKDHERLRSVMVIEALGEEHVLVRAYYTGFRDSAAYRRFLKGFIHRNERRLERLKGALER